MPRDLSDKNDGGCFKKIQQSAAVCCYTRRQYLHSSYIIQLQHRPENCYHTQKKNADTSIIRDLFKFSLKFITDIVCS